MAIGSLGIMPPITKAENKLAIFDVSSNAEMSFSPSFEANAVNFGNHSENHVRIEMMVKGEKVVILLAPSASESYRFSKAIIGSVKLVAVRVPFKSGGGVIDASQTAPLDRAAGGFIDINLIREQ